MNTFTKVILVSAVISLPIFSGNFFSHEQSGAKSGQMMNDMMMSNQQMMGMREKMHDNQSLMEQIRAEGNADKRTQLMQEHMNSMNQQMGMMNKMMGDDRASMAGVEMPEHMQMMQIMNSRMNMMQMMMEQMMEHQDEDQHRDN
jgi:protein CpxP